MTWQLFTVIQIAAFALAALTALGLRNRRLRRRNDELLTLCGQAHEELVAVSGKLAEIETTIPPEKLLAERVKALSGDDPVVKVRRMVLEHEIKPRADFAERLAEHLAGEQEAPPDEEEFARRWRLIRAECQQLAMFLVADNPDSLPAIRQIFEVVEPLDQAYGLDLPSLDLPAAEPTAQTQATEAATDAGAAAEGAGSAQAADANGEQELDQEALDALVASAQGAPSGEPEAADESQTGEDDLQPEARTGTG